MAYRRGYGRRKTSRRRSTRRRAGSRGSKRIVIEVRHTGGAPVMGPGAISPTLGKKAPQQLRPRF